MAILQRPSPHQLDLDHRLESRPKVRGKFLSVNGEKLCLKGVTYGTFAPGPDGNDYPDPEVVARDFRSMAGEGINCVRTYTVPPRYLLDAAYEHRLHLLIGIPWEEHVTFLDDRAIRGRIEETVRGAVRAVAGHPAVLAYAIGNEIPAPIVRWHGRKQVQRFLGRLARAVREEDPEGLVTYVNYPSTQYLELPFVDFVSFNVYLETAEAWERYLPTLQTLAGDKPLVMAEMGLDSRRNGKEQQAEQVASQIRAVFQAGCAGAFVFAWTDEWYRGGAPIEDWDFGLTDRDRSSKPALAAASTAFADAPFPRRQAWPRVSVVVCTYNGSRTIEDCCRGLLELDYPDFEVIVVDDGSTDGAGEVAASYGFRVLRTENQGLSAARNTGLEAATGEIVAYLDDDARPDPDWLRYLATAFVSSGHVAVGGPNIPPESDGTVAHCVANAPGGPVHVLLTDTLAEHIPGCNFAVRRAALRSIGGFDRRFRVAGDDVDACWRLQDAGGTVGFAPSAMVWHHRRNSLKTYVKQQVGYGKAEALLEDKWPARCNSYGYLTWAGNIYGAGVTRALSPVTSKVYMGVWGSAPFQSLYQGNFSAGSITLMPEWALLTAILGLTALLGLAWTPLLFAIPFFVAGAGVSLAQAIMSARKAVFPRTIDGPERLGAYALTAMLHLIQPVARLWGRQRHGLTAWRFWHRTRHRASFGNPLPRTVSYWRETWAPADAILNSVQAWLHSYGTAVRPGGEFDRWDLEVPGGMLGATRMRVVIEEHGQGRQVVRLRLWPRASRLGLLIASAFLVVGLAAAFSSAALPAGIFLFLGGLLLIAAGQDFAAASGCFRQAIESAMRHEGVRC